MRDRTFFSCISGVLLYLFSGSPLCLDGGFEYSQVSFAPLLHYSLPLFVFLFLFVCCMELLVSF